MHIQTVLTQLGYPMNQVKIYLACLKMGEGTISDIAEQVSMPRTTVTELLEDMHARGLMNYYRLKGHKYWVAENPDKLMVMAKERQAALQAVLPDLHALKSESGMAKPVVRTYFGVKDVQNIYEDIIETQRHMMAVVSWDDVTEVMGDTFMEDFIERRTAHFLRMRLITPKSKTSLQLKSHDSEELRVTRFLPEGIALRRVSNFIYGGKVAIISLNQKVPTGIIIQDADVAYAQSVYFESLWQVSSER